MSSFIKALEGLPTQVTLAFARFKPGEKVVSDDPILSSMDMPLPEEVTVIFNFSESGFGFGQVVITQTRDGIFVGTECMGLERVKRYINQFLDSAIADTDLDPERHALYKRGMGVQCGPSCPVCFPEGDAG